MARTPKRTDRDEKNDTGSELEILKNLEKAFYNNNPSAQKRNTLNSLEWFRKYIPRAYNKVRTGAMFRDRELWSDRIVPGNMYFFEYDPKHKATLPIYDRYPMIFPWDVWKGGDGYGESGVTYMIAINLHYLKPADRMTAMKALLTLRNEKRYRESTKLKISWQVLKGLSNSRMFEHSVKVYRLDHVRSKFVKIPPKSWEMSVFLPLHRFVKGSKTKAWKL